MRDDDKNNAGPGIKKALKEKIDEVLILMVSLSSRINGGNKHCSGLKSRPVTLLLFQTKKSLIPHHHHYQPTLTAPIT